MSEKQILTTLLEELQKTVQSRGIPGTIALLVNGRDNFSPNKNIQFVLLTVLNQFSITIEQLLNDKNDTTKYAKGMIVYFLRKEFDIEWTQIKIVLSLNTQSWLWELMKLARTLKPHLASELPYYNAKKVIGELIKQYKLTTTNTL